MEEKLNAPADFLTGSAGGTSKVDLMTPSHFTACPHSGPSLAVRGQGAERPWALDPQTTSQGVAHTDPWLAIAEAKREILELRRENQRMMRLHGNVSGKNQNPQELVALVSRIAEGSVQVSADRLEAEWRLDVDRLKAEVERLRGQLEALKELSTRQRDEIREQDGMLSRQSYDLQEAHSELGKTKAELNQTVARLNHSKLEQDKLCVQLDRLQKVTQEERERLEKEVQRGRQEAQSMKIEVEHERQKMEAASKLEVLRLKEELEEVQKKQKAELLEMSLKYQTELSGIREASAELQDKLSTSRQEVVQLESSLQRVCEEREKLREELSKLGKAFDSQSASLQSLRSYIGQLVPENSQQEELTVTIQKLEREKEALQETVELQSIRLKSLNDILVMQEKEMEEKTPMDPLAKGSPKSHKVLLCWRQKVFALLVQLRTRDIETRNKRHELVSRISSLEEEVKRHAYQASVLQHSMLDRSAELNLERVGRQTAEQELTQIREENIKLKESFCETRSGLKKITEDIKRFSRVFEAKVSDVQAAQSRLLTLGQRLTFALSRVGTVQGLIMRKDALRKLQQAAKMTDPDPASVSFRDVEAELVRMCEERDRLTEELKRTPALIEGALSEARQQFKSELQELKQALQRSREDAQEARQSMQETRRQQEAHAQSEEQLRAQLASLQEHSARELKERLSEMEGDCTQRLREMEVQLNAARREHTKAVVTLRQSERQAEREKEREREIRLIQDQQTQKQLHDLQKRLQEADRDRNMLMATIRENGLIQQYKAARTTALKMSTVLTEQQAGSSSGKTQASRPNTDPAMKESLHSVLGDLQALSAAVINGSDGSEEEEGGVETADKHSETARHRRLHN